MGVEGGGDGEWNHSHQGRGQFTVHRTQCVHADVLRRTGPYLLRGGATLGPLAGDGGGDGGGAGSGERYSRAMGQQDS
ncbi:unnamed protein product [Boreogadus saida]